MAKYLKILLIIVMTADAAHATPVAKRKPITPPDFQWVDAEGKWSRLKNGADGDAAGNAINGSGSGGKGGAGSGKGGAGNGGTEFTQNPGGGKNGGNGNGNGNGGGEQSGSSVTPGGGMVIHNLWWPICAFVDETVSEQTANDAIKGQIEMANKCGVNVVFWTKTVKQGSWKNEPNSINQKSVEKCNLPPSLAAKGSATALVRWDNTAAQMSNDRTDEKPPKPPYDAEGWNLSVAGCAELGQGASFDKKTIDAMNSGGHKHGSSAAKGGVAASIEVPSGHSAGVLAHESQGHSQMSKPNGTKYGNGIGEQPEDKGAEGSADGGWSEDGCRVMRATALPNDRHFGYDPKRTDYYFKPRNADAYYDIENDPPIFPASQDFAMKSGNGSIVTPPGQTITFKDDSKGQNPPEEKKTFDKKGQATETLDGEDTRHRRKNVVNALLDSLKEEGGLIEDPTRPIARRPMGPPNSDPAKANPRLGYDDNAAKGKVGSSGGETVTSADPSPTDIYSGANAPGDASGLEVGSREPASSGTYVGGAGKGAALGYDESAPKGGLVGGATVGSSSASGGASGALYRVVGSMGGDYKKTSIDGEEEFFDGVGEDGRKLRRRTQKRTTGLRESPQTGLREPSAVGRASRSQRAPASSP